MRLDGKRALITGASRGIGQGIALRFAAEGADLAINYVQHRDHAEETAAQVRKAGRKAVVLQADVSKTDQARALVRNATTELGGLDILVNNAGIEKRASLLDITEEDYREVIDVNLNGPFFLTQEFVRHLVSQKRPGKVINISSVHEELPFPHFTPYCMAKGGLKMMMRNLAVELGSCGITVNNIAPGAIETPMNKAMLSNPELVGRLLQNIPLGRVGQPSDVAGLAVYLASADADYVTGSTYYVDGGLTWNYSEQ